jgi:heme oxygenase
VQLGSLVSRLEVATRPWHADLDAPWLHLVRHDVTRDDYLAVLLRTFGFVAPLESACKYTPGLERMIDIRRLTHAGLIAQDLLTLGISPAELARAPQCLAITTFQHVPEALGWLYVVERSVRIQHGIRDHLQTHVSGLGNACAYLTELVRARARWDELARSLDRLSTCPEVANELVAAATAGSACAKRWYEDEHQVRRRTGS